MVIALAIGLAAGYVVRYLLPGRHARVLPATMPLGLVGAGLGFLVFTEAFGIGENDAFNLDGLPGAIIGAVIVLSLYLATRIRTVR